MEYISEMLGGGAGKVKLASLVFVVYGVLLPSLLCPALQPAQPTAAHCSPLQPDRACRYRKPHSVTYYRASAFLSHWPCRFLTFIHFPGLVVHLYHLHHLCDL